MTRKDLLSTEFNSYYLKYVEKLSSNVELRAGYLQGERIITDFFSSLSTEKLTHRYKLDKWNVKEILQHIIDTERIFIYRCFRIARKDDSALVGFDQNIYIKPSNAANKTIQSLIEEYNTTRKYSLSILNSLSDEDLCYQGIASGSVMSARAAAFIILGHEIWHIDVIKEKYL